jgi:hypothetical protein
MPGKDVDDLPLGSREEALCFRNNFHPGNQRRLAAKKIGEAGNQELTGDRHSPFI